MDLDCSRIVADSNEYLKLTYDVSMKEASPAELHGALGHVTMMQLSRRWSECKNERKGKRHAYYFSAEYLIGRPSAVEQDGDLAHVSWNLQVEPDLDSNEYPHQCKQQPMDGLQESENGLQRLNPASIDETI